MAYKPPGLLPVSQGDKEQALYQGLLRMGANMGGYSDKPVGLLGQFSKGGQAFAGGYQDQIAKNKAEQFQNLQAKQQQAQIEAERMKIEEAQRQKAIEDKRKKAALAYTQTLPPTADPLRQAQMEADPYGLMQSDVSSRSAAATRAAEQRDRVELERIKAAGKTPARDWAVVDGKPKLMAESEIAAQGLPKYERSRVKSEEELAQDIEVAKATAGNRPLTSAQAEMGRYALRMTGATSQLKKTSSGPDGKLGTADDYVPSRVDVNISKLPGGNSMVSDEYRQYMQAQTDWASANLRDESGAIISKDEMADELIKYFPQPGDDAKTIAQKHRSRRVAESAMKVGAGRAFEEMKEDLGGNPYEGFEVVK